MKKAWDRSKIHSKFWWENVKGSDHLKELHINRRITLR
jgi:hypothetical protein